MFENGTENVISIAKRELEKERELLMSRSLGQIEDTNNASPENDSDSDSDTESDDKSKFFLISR